MLGGSIVLDQLIILHGVSSPHPVDLLVYLSPVMVALLASSGNSELDPARHRYRQPSSGPCGSSRVVS